MSGRTDLGSAPDQLAKQDGLGLTSGGSGGCNFDRPSVAMYNLGDVKPGSGMGLGFDGYSRVWTGVFMEGGGPYSVWWNIGEGGSRARSRNWPMNGGMAMKTPRVTSDHDLMKWMAEHASAKV
ncbi:hypothetical protein Acr_00g0017240 [Actinidia rufa]|uniref:Uncharacterized protein n=1 Tax=Actinidia rufa TaxID=165716 RepID=A0A7J0DB37_9ERIC|nr:hypothetical protein Acr_00g0017240 [Actinidia rufa]